MHRCLCVTEIVWMVTIELYNDRGGVRNAASLALTCRTIFEPAMDVLWREEVSLLDLVCVLPGHTRAVRGGQVVRR